MYVARHSVVSLEFARCSQIQFRFYRNLGRFQFEEKFLFNFLANGIHEWNSIFTEFPLHSIFLPKFFGISFQWFALRKFDVYPDFLEIFPGSFSFRSFVVFGLLCSPMLVASYLHQVIIKENLPFIFVNYRFGYFCVNVKACLVASILFYYLFITLTFALQYIYN